MSQWNGIYPDDGAFIFQNVDPSDFAAVELQANSDTATVLRNESGTGVFERGL
ncbi:hypothetical protein [Mesorhizobium opportunistum]|uniref:hypothetical protein n=1 Tax=Mesorhizobium opportunistum TaxID=593909 RepID=UPI0002D8DEBC|nr:hypothetical protein [Mesorhizobium opportunistum]